jgi:hypothetical protein
MLRHCAVRLLMVVFWQERVQADQGRESRHRTGRAGCGDGRRRFGAGSTAARNLEPAILPVCRGLEETLPLANFLSGAVYGLNKAGR